VSGRDPEPVEISYERVLDDTPAKAAIRFEIEGARHWIPRSQISEHDPDARTFQIPEWLAYERGLI